MGRRSVIHSEKGTALPVVPPSVAAGMTAEPFIRKKRKAAN
jgi:hypothetical protein